MKETTVIITVELTKVYKESEGKKFKEDYDRRKFGRFVKNKLDVDDVVVAKTQVFEMDKDDGLSKPAKKSRKAKSSD